MSLERELRIYSDENTSLAVAVNEYKVRGKSLKKKVYEEKTNGITLLRKLRPSKQNVERPECEYKLL